MTDAHEKEFQVTVDGEEISAPRKDLTPCQLLQLAGLDIAERYLIAKLGNTTESYRDKLDEVIKGLHQKMIFLTGSLGPVPVS